MVDGDPLVGVPAGQAARAGRTDGRRRIRRVRDAARPHAHARPEGGRASLAVHRGSADGRSDAPADAPGGRPVRARAARPERCAAPAGGAVEVRLQGNQVDREDHAAVDAAGDDLEHEPHRASTGSSPTSTPRSTTRGGVRRPSNGSASRVVGRRSCSTAMARRWPISTRVWTCGQTSDAGGTDEGHSIRQIHRASQLRRAGHPPRLGRLEGPARRQPGQLRHPDDRAALADLPGPHTPGHSRESNHPVELAGPVPPDAWTVRVLSRLPAFFDLLRVRPRGERERHSVGDHQASLPDGGNARPGADGAAGGDLDRRHDQAAGRQAVEGAAPAGLRRRGGGRGPLLHAREGRRQRSRSRSRSCWRFSWSTDWSPTTCSSDRPITNSDRPPPQRSLTPPTPGRRCGRSSGRVN